MRDPQQRKLRLFYALWPDAATRAALTRLQLAVRGRNMRPENFHLTLAFLGEQPIRSLARNAQPPEELTIAPVLWHADHVALVQSDSLDQGRQYRILASRWLRP